MKNDRIHSGLYKKYKKRAKAGIKKYGVGMDRKDLPEIAWLHHLQEELMDATLYIERLIQDKENRKE